MNTKPIAFAAGLLLAAFTPAFAQPIIVTQPQSQSVRPGNDATLTVVAEGFQPLTYQWRRYNVLLPGATNDSLTVSNVQYTHSGNYEVIVYDDQLLATTSAVAVLTIEAPFTRITSGAIATDAAHSFGCAWGDYDDDGWLELVVGNGYGAANALYHNNRDGTFTRLTTGAIPTLIGDSDGCVWGDYDNDGDLDLFIANWELASYLFRNDGNGNFTRVTNGILTTPANSVGCAWGDYDGNGFLDLVVANSRGQTGNGQNEHLYRNTGTGSFDQVLTGPVVSSGLTSGLPLWSDFDGDGKIDLSIAPPAFIVADSLSAFFHNAGGGMFTRVTNSIVGIAEGGSDWGDYDNDGDLDLIGGQVSGSQSSAKIFRNDGAGGLTPTLLASLPATELLSGEYSWADYDNDGWLDVFVAAAAYPVLTGPIQKDLLFHNNGNGTFTRVLGGSIVNDLGTGYGAAWADYDNDGFLDLFVANGGERGAEVNFLYHNDGNSNRWLSLKCIGGPSNRSGIGAKVRVRSVIAGVELWQMREITSGHGYNGSGLRTHFGLGDATNVDLVRIEWPSGTVQELRNLAVNQFLTVTETPRLEAAGRLPDGSFQLRLTGATGLGYRLETSSNLSAWTEWQTVTNTSRTTLYTDPSATAPPHRFFRAVAP